MPNRRGLLVAATVLAAAIALAAVLLIPGPGKPHRPAPTRPVAPPRQPLSDGPIGAHSMLYLTAPPAFKEAMFREAAAMGASEIRVDVELSGIFPEPGRVDWTGLEDYERLARKYGLRVLGDI